MQSLRIIFIHFILCSCLFYNAYSQTGFSKSYTFNGYPVVMTDAKLIDNSICATGLMADTVANRWVNFIIKLDLNGNITDTIYKALPDNYSYTVKNLICKSNNEFITTGTCGNYFGIIYQYKNDSLYNHYLFKDTTKEVNIVRAIINDRYNNYYILVGIQDIYSVSDINFEVFKMDSNFNEIWHREYGVAGMNEDPGILPGTIIELNDGNILIGKCKTHYAYTLVYYDGFPYNVERYYLPTYFLKIDTAGNVLQQWTNPDNHSSEPCQVVQTEDNKYIYCGAYSYYDLYGSTMYPYPYSKNYVCKRNANFNLEWEVKLSDAPSQWTYLWDLVVYDDKIFTVGHEYDSVLFDNRGVLYCFDSTGFMMYKRYFNTPFPLNTIGGNDPSSDNPYLYSIDIPNDSTIIMAGEVQKTDMPPNVPVQYGWVVKTNIYGCLDNTGQFNYAGFENTNSDEKLNVAVYPNPASYAFQVDISDQLINSRFTISNSMGQLLQRGILNAPTTIFDIENYSPGVYYISIYSQYGNKSIKIVKQ